MSDDWAIFSRQYCKETSTSPSSSVSPRAKGRTHFFPIPIHEVYALKLIQLRVSRSRTYAILEAELLGSFANMRSLTLGKTRRKTYLTYGTINTYYPRDNASVS